ncbi:MAG TPA: hypothetical protein VJQ45_02085, partial [Ktedonobacterales bacterium]|nr:hypothetical protein [Ktedonobacterales bacterium]
GWRALTDPAKDAMRPVAALRYCCGQRMPPRVPLSTPPTRNPSVDSRRGAVVRFPLPRQPDTRRGRDP